MELKICVPEEMKYICYMCDCQITTKNNLEKHIQSIHEQIKYTGSFCDQQADRQESLKMHIQSVHRKILAIFLLKNR